MGITEAGRMGNNAKITNNGPAAAGDDLGFDEHTALLLLGVSSAFVMGTLLVGVLLMSLNSSGTSRACTYGPIVTVATFFFSMAYALFFERMSIVLGSVLGLLFVFTVWRKDLLKAVAAAPIAVMVLTIVCQVLLRMQFKKESTTVKEL
eukprot:TRINITY_DN6404_c0_g1_i1.p1 TRINITY_DN6404_c0_g1~~TRINITY_DN6404_c0_g1_i1.p1  ORF type:complete len:149 (-),score=27.35 TRINITY_DN6404_c0_g1_i1:165-611(-)